MSSITFSGLGSGMDYAAWVEELVAAKKAETVTPLENKKTEYENSKSALDIVEGYFEEFQDSLEAFTNISEYSSNDIFNQKSAKSSFDEYLKVTCTNESLAGKYDIQILQMATSTVVKSASSAASVVNGSTAFGDIQNSKAGTFTITVGGNQMEEISIEETDTLDDIATKINNIFPDDLEATVTNDGIFKITTKTDKSVILGADTDTSSFKSTLKITQGDNDEFGNRVFESVSSVYNANSAGTIAGAGATANLSGTINAGTIKINGVEFEIAEDTTIDSLIRQINANAEVGVEAHFDANAGTFNLTSKSTGARAISMEDVDGTGFFETMKMSYDANSTIPGKDAMISINGSTKVSSSNTFTDTGYVGLTLEILDEPDETLSITATVENDSSGVKSAIENFVTKYNQVVSAIKEATASEGYLEYDSSLRTIYREMRSIVSGVYNTGFDFNMLSDLGISTGDAGLSATDSATKLVFNSSKFDELLETHALSDLKSIFSNADENASFDLLNTKITQSLDPTSGYFHAKGQTLANLISTQTSRIESANKQLTLYEERLLAQFQAMDSAISDMNNQYNSFVDSISQLA